MFGRWAISLPTMCVDLGKKMVGIFLHYNKIVPSHFRGTKTIGKSLHTLGAGADRPPTERSIPRW